MPAFSKKIIAAIKSETGDFTGKELAVRLIPRGHEKKTKKGKGKKAKPRAPERSLSLLEKTLEETVAAGLVKRNKNRFTRIHSFIVEGRIRIKSSGDGILQSGDGEIIIRKDDSAGARNNDLVSAEIVDVRKGAFYGEVKKIIRRDRDLFFAKAVNRTRDLVIFNLLDVPGNQEVCSIPAEEGPSPGDMALVRLEQGSIKDRQRCSVIKVFSPDDDRYDLDRIVMKHALPGPHIRYPELSDERNLVHDSGTRKDYTSWFTVTIDGKSAKDFDDAVSIEKKGDVYLLAVHIADVSAYVRKDSGLDREALNRGTSHYLGNSVIPMLPEILSNDLCSLREGVDRLTMSVEMRIDRGGKILDHSFHRGIIRVAKRLTYDLVDEILASAEKSRLHDALSVMYELTSVLHAKRIVEGSLELNLTEEALIYENNVVTDIRYSTRLKSHQIIEEFMLYTNVVVSRSLRQAGAPSLYRNHEPVSPESLQSLKQFLRQMHIPFKTSGNAGMNIQRVLGAIAGTEIEHVVNLVILKSLMQAYYGAIPEGHFGLGFADYTHFTSPIRRYPDLVVHRCLKSLMDGSRPPYSQNELIFIGDKSSEMERVAQSAERDFKKIKSCRLMEERVGEVFQAMVTGVSRYGFYVTLAETPIDGMVPLWALTDDFYLVKEDEYTVVGRRYGRRFRIGDKIAVRLTNVEIERMIIDFDLA
jgi:ribonuclease R